MKTTRRKVRVIGKETYINQNTGEIVEMNVIEEQERDANFHKIWIGHIVQALEMVGNKKLKVVTYIMDNLNSENLFIMTQREMEKNLKISLKTISETMRALQEANFLKIKQAGVYQVNPNVMFKGSKGKRLNVLIRYKQIESIEGQINIEGNEE